MSKCKVTCKEYAEYKKDQIRQQVGKLRNCDTPTLVVIQVGDNPSINSYIKGKRKDCEDVGIKFSWKNFPENTTTEYLVEVIKYLNGCTWVTGIIVQLPVPEHINVQAIQKIIKPEKDVDGFNISSPFEPCTPLGVMNYLKHCGYKFEGSSAVVIGRSDIVGKPLARMLTDENATVTLCHSKTPEINVVNYCMTADYVFTCIDKIEYFTGNNSMFSNAKCIIDIGLGVGEDDKLHGNIQHELLSSLESKPYADTVISGTGGVGLLTRVTLLENVMKAYELQTLNN